MWIPVRTGKVWLVSPSKTTEKLNKGWPEIVTKTPMTSSEAGLTSSLQGASCIKGSAREAACDQRSGQACVVAKFYLDAIQTSVETAYGDLGAVFPCVIISSSVKNFGILLKSCTFIVSSASIEKIWMGSPDEIVHMTVKN